VETYWPRLQELLPALADSLVVNFGYVPVASTIVEQTFTIANNQVHPNAAISTMQSNISLAVNVRGAIRSDIDDLRAYKAARRDGAAVGAGAEAVAGTRRTVQAIMGPGLKKQEMLKQDIWTCLPATRTAVRSSQLQRSTAKLTIRLARKACTR